MSLLAMNNQFDLYQSLQEIRSFLKDSSGEELVLKSADMPQQMAVAFAAVKGQIVQKHWLIKIRNIATLPERERFILASIPGRELLIKYICDFDLALSLMCDRLYSLCIDEEWIDLLKKFEQREAIEISKKLLIDFLPDSQRRAFQETEGFLVYSENEKFLVTNKAYYSFDDNDYPKWGFCIHPGDWLPIYDQMLTIKLLLETNLPLFHALANKRELSFEEKLNAVLVLGQIETRKMSPKQMDS